MFKKLFNLLFRRKPKHPAVVRKTDNGVIVVAHTEEEADRYEAAANKMIVPPYAPSPRRRYAEMEALRLQRQQPAWPTPRREDVIREAAQRVRREDGRARREFTTSPADLLNPMNPASPNYVGSINTYNHPVVSECSTRHSHSHHDSSSSYDSGSSDSSSSSSSCD